MNKKNIVQWVLRVSVAGEFLGHGVFAIQGKAQWVGWMKNLIGVSDSTALQILLLIGAVDVLLALIVLIKPIKPLLLWMTFWGFFTAIIRPIAGESFWDFIERWANWGAPLSLYLLSKSNENE